MKMKTKTRRHRGRPRGGSGGLLGDALNLAMTALIDVQVAACDPWVVSRAADTLYELRLLALEDGGRGRGRALLRARLEDIKRGANEAAGRR